MATFKDLFIKIEERYRCKVPSTDTTPEQFRLKRHEFVADKEATIRKLYGLDVQEEKK